MRSGEKPLNNRKRMRKNRWLFAMLFALLIVPAAAMAQGATITGRVTDEAGSGLFGASVLIPSMNVGTITRADGTYALIIPAGRFQAGQQVQLRAQQVGYQAQTVGIALTAGTITQNFQLTVDPLRLEEVIVTGAGLTQRAERLGTARSTVSSDMLQRANEPNVITALAQKAPNVVTTQSSGEAGASTAIRIRGTSTLAGTGQPTIVVDGVPINNATRMSGSAGTPGSALGGTTSTNRAFDINPDDIESIEILKGPAATSILGASAGAGGAILITTRRGRAGQTRYTMRSTIQFDEVANNIPLQTRFGSGTGGAGTPCLTSPTPGCTHNNPAWGPALAAGTPVFDHSSELFETGAMFDNTMAISGGSDRTTFYLSLGVLNHNGFIAGDNDKYERYTVRLNGDHRLLDNLRVGGNVSYVQTQGQFIERGNSVNGLLLGALRTPPEFNNLQYLDPEFGLHRSYRFPMPRAQDVIANRGFDNPFFAINENPNLGEVGRVYGNITANWNALPWLDVNYSLGADYANDDRTNGYHVSSSGGNLGGAVTRWQFYDRIIDHNLTATASFPLGARAAGTFSLGQNLQESYFRQIWVEGRPLVAPAPFKIANTVDRSPPVDPEFRTRLEGYFGQVELDWAEQLFLTLRLRNDGASTFGTETNRAWYPGGQLAWTFTEMLNIPENVLSFGKVRVAYGESGQQPAAYQLQDIFTNVGIADFNPGSILNPTLGGFGGLYTGLNLGNPGIKPERVAEIDAGVDFTILGGRADASVTYYLSKASDVIFGVNTPPSTGATTQTLNAAEIENRGWELMLNTRPVQTRDFGITLGANWAANRNEVLSLGEIAPGVPREVTGFSASFTGSTTHAQVGEPVGIFRGFGYVRCGMGSAESNATYQTACQGAPHGAVYINAAGLPVADPDERIIGDPNPDWTAGLNAEVQFRGVRLSAFVDHRQGGDVFNMTRGSLASLGVHATTDIRDQAPTPYGQIYNVPVVGPGANTPVQLGQSFFGNLGGLGTREHLMEDGTFTRLREVSLAYTFNQPWVGRTLGLSSIDARISGRNLALWTDYSGYDPEVHTGGAAVANRGIDWFVMPTSRAFVVSFGLNR